MNRKSSIDVLRIISTIAIIIIHAVTSPVAHSTGEVAASLKDNLTLVHIFMLWAVPVFFMITGYGLLSKSECTYEYCFRHVLKYVGILFTVGLFYALLEKIFVARSFQFSVIYNALRNVIAGNLWDHMWFVYSIIGIYLVMPVVHYFMQSGEKNILILTGLLFFFTILSPAIEKWLPIGVAFPFGGYLFYVCFGAAVAKLKVKNVALYVCIAAGIGSVIYILATNHRHVLEYRHPAVCLMAMSIFLIFYKIEMRKSSFVTKISQCTWGIYLLHPFFINVAIRVLKVDLLSYMPYVFLLVFIVILFGVSLAATYILKKIPLIKVLF